MKDAIFIARLHSQKLIVGDDIHKLHSGSTLTPAEAATYFLNNVIEPTIRTEYNEPFCLLLLQMESFSGHLAVLAATIKTEIQLLHNSVTGHGKNKCTNIKCIHMHVYMYMYLHKCI